MRAKVDSTFKIQNSLAHDGNSVTKKLNKHAGSSWLFFVFTTKKILVSAALNSKLKEKQNDPKTITSLQTSTAIDSIPYNNKNQ
jgi:hypothetical protein